MFAKALAFWGILLVYQLFRFVTFAWLASSDLQAYILWISCGLVGVDIVCLRWIYQRMGLASKDGNLAPLGARDPYGIAVLCFVFYLCATPFCTTICMLNGTNLLIADGPLVGPLSIQQALQHPEAGVMEFNDGILKPNLQGAVKYHVTSRVTQFYYAVPFVTKGWTDQQPVNVWAILEEHDMSAPDLHDRRFGYVVRPKHMHYAAFAKAVDNAEERSAVRSGPDAILVRLTSTPPGEKSSIWSETKWIGLIYLTTWFLTGLFAFLAYAAQSGTVSEIAIVRSETIQSSNTDRVSTATRSSQQRPEDHASSKSTGSEPTRRLPSQRRRRWFVLHLTILTISTLGILNLSSVWAGLLGVLASALFEIWLLRRSFSAMRGTPRYQMVLVMLPLTLWIGALFTIAGADQFAAIQRLDQAKRIDLEHLEVDAQTQYVEFTDNPHLRGDKAGYFFAPSKVANSWWMVPVVPANWTPAMPVRVWMQTTSREKKRDLKGTLHFAKIMPSPLSLRSQQALEDAVKYYHLKSAPDAIVLTREHEIREQRSEAGGMVVLAVTTGLLAWIACACYWPK
ncbi:MAG: hypothetical protein JWM11_4999 [Planctomycetaceae bacterium]|nr:hypothetical protein [Planctomycetaceae bacterium]